MRLLTFGSRTFNDTFIVDTVLRGFLAGCATLAGEKLVIIDGDAPGADELAGAFFLGPEEGLHERYPADWARYGRKAAGPIRNRQMLAEGRPERAVGFVHGLDADGLPNTPGSRNMAEQLLKAGVPTFYVVAPALPESPPIARTGL